MIKALMKNKKAGMFDWGSFFKGIVVGVILGVGGYLYMKSKGMI